jgi:diguanylate cyclase (GGDEF)-like protein
VKNDQVVEHPVPSGARLALYFAVRYATPVMVFLAVAASSFRPDSARLTAILSAQVVVALGLHLLTMRGAHSVVLALRAGMVADIVMIAALVQATGGTNGPMLFLFTVYVMSAGILISSRSGMRMLGLSTLAILGLDLASKNVASNGFPHGMVGAAALWILGGGAILFSTFNERELRRRTAELATIRQVTLDIEASLSLKEIFADLCRGVVAGFDFDAAAVLQRGEGGTLHCAGAHGVTGSNDAVVELRGGVARAMSNPRPLVVTGDMARRDGALSPLLGPRGYIAVRIAEDGLLVATRNPRRRRAATLRAHEIEALDRLAHHARLAIANAVLHAKVSEMAKTDPLTGLANHGEMQRRLGSELAKVARYTALRAAGHHPSLVLIDIDHFKRLNDKYGHQAGDAVLKKISAVLRETVRSFDVVARYGGEEFAAILPGTNAETAQEVAERIRRTIAETPIWVADEKRVRVTISAGVATAPSNGGQPATLIKAADAALYRSKEAGRNRVTHALEEDKPVAAVLPIDVKRRRRERDEVPVRAATQRARGRSSLPKRRTPHA